MSAVNSLNVGPLKKKPGAQGREPARSFRNFFGIFLLLLIAASSSFSQSARSILPGPQPVDAPPEWKTLLGIYADKHEPEKKTFVLLEREGKLFSHYPDGSDSEFAIIFDDFPEKTEGAKSPAKRIVKYGAAESAVLGACCNRIDPGSDSSKSYLVKPQRPVEELRREALTATPPEEDRSFRKPDLIELATLDPDIHLDIRYASSNDFLGTPVYTQARAFLQRPAAEALLRVLQKLKPLGYGLLIHDGYRPWYVTKIFWDATPAEGKIFVADPAQGSRHNRGCAVDLTLYDLKTGNPIEMTGGYDEMSPRSFPNFPGGTSLQRWHRDLLRSAMESEDFTVYESEWWHFDYKDWHEYGILNIPFEKLNMKSN
ncbi:MAG: M15 family metallopeptidase [Acidobacteria bacterium]|nr:M15 family metallopeptidase [Acidobacteriota bacterium]MBS1866663.1 M15 family metallopeptidase [Acidobacteriota bacterium]